MAFAPGDAEFRGITRDFDPQVGRAMPDVSRERPWAALLDARVLGHDDM